MDISFRNTFQILLKPSVISDNFVKPDPVHYKDFLVTIKKMYNGTTKVVFKNVPLYVPDIEILNLCSYYGSVNNNQVIWKNSKVPGTNNTLSGSTRYVNMTMNKGTVMNNYYWMGTRILVQKRQCSHCLQWEDTGCKEGGNGKLCRENKEPRGRMFAYMVNINRTVGYKSMKRRVP